MSQHLSGRNNPRLMRDGGPNSVPHSWTRRCRRRPRAAVFELICGVTMSRGRKGCGPVRSIDACDLIPRYIGRATRRARAPQSCSAAQGPLIASDTQAYGVGGELPTTGPGAGQATRPATPVRHRSNCPPDAFRPPSTRPGTVTSLSIQTTGRMDRQNEDRRARSGAPWPFIMHGQGIFIASRQPYSAS